jgi:pyridoxal phosphate enzyme (YggS family)
MPDSTKRIEDNLRSIETRIAQACQRAGRLRTDVTLVAVTKYADLQWVEALIASGQTELGENRPQQLWERAECLPNTINWHLIGHLQSNKAKRLLPFVKWIHSIDSLKLLTSIDRLTAGLAHRPKALVEVNITGEASKDGFTAEELRRDWAAVCRCQNVELAGMMTMAAESDDPESARPAFRALRLLRDELQNSAPHGIHLPHLSMGMTGDFEVAIEEGATLVRIGSAIFEGLESPPAIDAKSV